MPLVSLSLLLPPLWLLLRLGWLLLGLLALLGFLVAVGAGQLYIANAVAAGSIAGGSLGRGDSSSEPSTAAVHAPGTSSAASQALSIIQQRKVVLKAAHTAAMVAASLARARAHKEARPPPRAMLCRDAVRAGCGMRGALVALAMGLLLVALGIVGATVSGWPASSGRTGTQELSTSLAAAVGKAASSMAAVYGRAEALLVDTVGSTVSAAWEVCRTLHACSVIDDGAAPWAATVERPWRSGSGARDAWASAPVTALSLEELALRAAGQPWEVWAILLAVLTLVFGRRRGTSRRPGAEGRGSRLQLEGRRAPLLRILGQPEEELAGRLQAGAGRAASHEAGNDSSADAHAATRRRALAVQQVEHARAALADSSTSADATTSLAGARPQSAEARLGAHSALLTEPAGVAGAPAPSRRSLSHPSTHAAFGHAQPGAPPGSRRQALAPLALHAIAGREGGDTLLAQHALKEDDGRAVSSIITPRLASPSNAVVRATPPEEGGLRVMGGQGPRA